MITPEILKIINAVAVGWPWQSQATSGAWVISTDQSLTNLMDEFVTNDEKVRLDPDFVWDWSISNQWNMFCWRRYPKVKGRPQIPFDDYYSNWFKAVLNPQTVYANLEQFVTPNPLNPDQPPPLDWSPEGKRIIE